MNHSCFRLHWQCGILLAALVPGGPGWASQNSTAEYRDTVQDYRYRMPLNSGSNQGVAKLRLPPMVYLHAQSLHLDDLRIFDGKGQTVPFARLPGNSQQSTTRSSVPLKIFPLRAAAAKPESANAANLEMDIHTDATGTLLSVKTKNGDNRGGNKLTHLVLDAGPAHDADDGTRIEGLRFHLPPGIQNYQAQVWLEVSDDLQHWDTVGTAELSWLLNRGNDTLTNDRLNFEARSLRYARLSWRSGEPIEFANIEALSVKQQNGAPPLESVTLQAQDGKQPGDLVYQASAALPVIRVNLQFGEPNVVYPATIGHYQEIPAQQIGKSNTWQFNADMQSTFYQINQDGKTRRSGELALSQALGLAQWVVRPRQPGNTRPGLVLSWQPANLIFLNNGNGPYTLAYGRSDARSGISTPEQVAPGFSQQELQKLALVTTGAEQPGSSPQQLQQQQSEAQAASKSAKTRSLILWGVLLLGVATLGGMAWSLVKQLKREK